MTLTYNVHYNVLGLRNLNDYILCLRFIESNIEYSAQFVPFNFVMDYYSFLPMVIISILNDLCLITKLQILFPVQWLFIISLELLTTCPKMAKQKNKIESEFHRSYLEVPFLQWDFSLPIKVVTFYMSCR